MISFRHHGWEKYHGHRCQVNPCPIRGVGKLEPVERLLKERRPTRQEGEEKLTCFSDVSICIEEAGGAVRSYECEPSPGQFSSSLCHFPHPLACRSLPHGGGDPLQVTDVVRPRYGAHGAPYPKVSTGSSTTGGRPYLGSSTQQSKIRQSV